MKIVTERPPNWSDIIKVFPHVVNPKSGVIFTYGDTIYNPYRIVVTRPLLEHEHVHELQQGAEPDFWWNLYLQDEKFRFSQELLAHAREYRVVRDMKINRHQRRASLVLIAKRLSGPLYGHHISLNDAKYLIEGAKKDDEAIFMASNQPAGPREGSVLLGGFERTGPDDSA